MNISDNIRKAVIDDVDAIEALYERIHTEEENGNTTIGWVRGVYPVRKTAEDSVARGDMYVLYENDTLLAAGIINKIQLDSYFLCNWSIEADDDNVMVLHTLVVDPEHKGKGIGREFVRFYEKCAIDAGCSVLRLDTQAKNAAARALYKKLGYTEAGIVYCEFFGISDIDLVCLEKKCD